MLRQILFMAILAGVGAAGIHTVACAGKGKDKFVQKKQEREEKRKEKEEQREREQQQERDESGSKHEDTGADCLTLPPPESK